MSFPPKKSKNLGNGPIYLQIVCSKIFKLQFLKVMINESYF